MALKFCARHGRHSWLPATGVCTVPTTVSSGSSLRRRQVCASTSRIGRAGACRQKALHLSRHCKRRTTTMTTLALALAAVTSRVAWPDGLRTSRATTDWCGVPVGASGVRQRSWHLTPSRSRLQVCLAFAQSTGKISGGLAVPPAPVHLCTCAARPVTLPHEQQHPLQL